MIDPQRLASISYAATLTICGVAIAINIAGRYNLVPIAIPGMAFILTGLSLIAHCPIAAYAAIKADDRETRWGQSLSAITALAGLAILITTVAMHIANPGSRS